jgi:molybdate transport system substrate-binding protein
MRGAQSMSREFVAHVVLALALLAGGSTAPASADEVRLLASNAVREPYLELIPLFEKASGHRVTAEWGGTVDIVRRATAGEALDVVVIPDARVNELKKLGAVYERVDLAASKIGVAGRPGAPRPNLANIDGLKRALLAANRLVISSGPSSNHMLALFARMGIADDIRPKLVQLAPGLSVGEAIAAGRGDIGFTQVSELLAIKGIDYLGPLPDGAQSVTTFSAGFLSTTRSPLAAHELVAFLAGAKAASVLKEHGLDPR